VINLDSTDDEADTLSNRDLLSMKNSSLSVHDSRDDVVVTPPPEISTYEESLTKDAVETLSYV
jgi:hypothetical protein